MTSSYIELPGSNRLANEDAVRVGSADKNQLVRITATVRRKQPLPEPDANSKPISWNQLEQQYGADPKDLERVKDAFASLGLTVTTISAGACTVEAEGTVSQMNQAFHVDLGTYESSIQGSYRGRDGSIEIPAQLNGVVTSILGLDERKVARRKPTGTVLTRDANAGTLNPQAPNDLATRYKFPTGGGNGQKIGILEFMGGFFQADLDQYCTQIAGLPSASTAKVVPVGLKSLSRAQIQAIADPNKRDQELGAAQEVNMDVQVAQGLCPQAQLLVFFAPFNQKGWVDIINAATNGPNAVDVISVSWGNPEDAPDGFSQGAIAAINDALKAAALMGINVCVSSGDDGVSDGLFDGKAHCDFPSSSPYVLAVGGTQFDAVSPETGWWVAPGARNGSGSGSSTGGRSTVFATPNWQNVNVVSVRTGQASGRCVPDVSALAGNPGYNLIFAGQTSPNGGTSASAPLWAALIASVAANLPSGKSVGFLTPKLYQLDANGKPIGASVTTDILAGQNEVLADPAVGSLAVNGYTAGPGYDAVTGWGVPNGVALLNFLSA